MEIPITLWSWFQPTNGLPQEHKKNSTTALPWTTLRAPL